MRNPGLALLLIGWMGFTGIQCHKEGSVDPIMGMYLISPVISDLSPRIGTPRQDHPDRPYPPSLITIRGRNFFLPDIRVRFNSVTAGIIYNTGTEMQVEVPTGATSGFVYVTRDNSECSPLGGEGFLCSGTEFFVDCYAPYNQEYGKEIPLAFGTNSSQAFVGVQSRAYRAESGDLPIQTGTIRIECPSPVTVREFSASCAVTDHLLVRNPTLTFQNTKIKQFIVTAENSACSVSFL